jgi:hypothetical protein
MNDLLRHLESDFLYLQLAWECHKDLYQHDRKRVDLLNNVARNFFYMHDRMLRREISVGITRLLDNPATGKRKNLVLEDLIERADPRAQKDLHKELDAIRELAESIREYRHEVVAHRDWRVAFKNKSYALNLHEVLPRIHRFIFMAQGKEAPPFGRAANEHHSGGAVDLVHALERVRRPPEATLRN